MRDVPREAGVSSTTVYRYFSGKQKIVEAVAEDLCRRDVRWAEGLLRTTTREDGRSPERLSEMLLAESARRPRADARLRTELWAEAARDPGVAKTLSRGVELLSELFERMARLRRNKEAAGSSCEKPSEETLRFVALFHGVSMLRPLETLPREPRPHPDSPA